MRPRPHIPVGVKLAVAERQLRDRGAVPMFVGARQDPSTTYRLRWILYFLFNNEPCHLDHDPPLMLREFDQRTGKYTPDANDPDHLVYRSKEEHRIKTFIRGDGAQLSDAGKRRKEIGRRKKATRPKRRWPTRPLGRKIR